MNTERLKEEPTLKISQELFNEWLTQQWPKDHGNLRYGQSFYNYFDMHKVTSPKNRELLDRIYNADNVTAGRLIAPLIEYPNFIDLVSKSSIA